MQVVVLADQTFPAILPAEGQARCMQIILVENGSIPDIIDEFQKQLGNRRVPPGSVLLIFSASHLLNVGLAQYAADLVDGIKMIEGKFGKETIVQPLPTIFLDGTDNEELIRSTMELNEWVADYFGGADNFLEEANKIAKGVMADLGDGSMRTPEARRYVLPAKTQSGKRVWNSGGVESRAWPCKIRPLTHNMEMKVIIALIEELRGKMVLDLDPAPSFDRTLGPQRKAKKKCELMIVGCCKTKEMSKILSNRGKTTSSVFSNNWRITRASVESLATNLRRQIEAEEPETIVFELLDNSVFVGKQEDGSRLLPKKEADGRYHIHGEVQVCARDVQLEQFSALKPIFEAAADKKIIWMVPAARYLTGGCCENREHVSNKNDPHLREDILMQLESLKRNMRDHVYYTNRRIKIFDVNQYIRSMSNDDIWGEDPALPKTEVIGKMVDGLMKMLDGQDSSREDQERPRDISRGRGRAAPPRGNWRGRGRGFMGNDSSRGGGRHFDPERRFGGRGSFGGHDDHRARPY
jgi:hypothetical protein